MSKIPYFWPLLLQELEQWAKHYKHHLMPRLQQTLKKVPFSPPVYRGERKDQRGGVTFPRSLS